MIEIRNVSKWYRHNKKKKTVLKNINLTLPSKSFICIFGSSGSGKSTLIRLISGLEVPSRGKIYLYGRKLTRKNGNKLRALDIGVILQGNNLDLEKTVYENVEISLKMMNLKEKYERISKVNYVLKVLNIYNLRKEFCKNLSGGEQKRVELARALVKNPKIIIADEATSSLDNKNSKLVLDILKSFSEKKLVIFITHNKKEALSYSKRIIYLKNGQILKDIKNNKESKFVYNKINIDNLDNSLNDIKYSSIYKLTDLLLKVFLSLKQNNIKKRFLIGLLISSSFLYLSLNVYNTKKSYIDINKYDKNYVRIITKNKGDISFTKNVNYSYFIKGNSLKKIFIKRNDYYKLNQPLISFESVIKKNNRVKNSYIWIDESLIELLFNDKKTEPILKMSGIDKSMNNVTILINNIPFTVEKIVSFKSPSIYFNTNDFNRILTINSKYQNYDVFKDYITITKGRKPIYDEELLINENSSLNSSNVIGTYKGDFDYVFMNNDSFKKHYYNGKEYSIYTKNKKRTIKQLKKLKITYIDDYSIMKQNIKNKQKTGLKKIRRFLTYMVLIFLFTNYFIIKSNISNSMQTIKTYRLLGVKKSDIYKFFILESIVINIIILLLSFIFMNYLIYEINKIEMFKYLLKFSVSNMIYCLLLCLSISLTLVIILIKKPKP